MAVIIAALAGAGGFGAMELAKSRIDPNGYRERIIGEIARASGIQAGFERLEWLPYRPGVAAIIPTLRKNGVDIRAGRLEAVISLPSLLFGPPRLSRLSIDGLVLTAERDEEGIWNLAQLFTGGGKDGGTPAPPDDVVIANANVVIVDAYAPRHAPVLDEPRQTTFDDRAAKDYFEGENNARDREPQLTPAEPVSPLSLYVPPAPASPPKQANDEPPPPKLLLLRGVNLHFHSGGWVLPTSLRLGAELIDPALRKNPLYRRLKPARMELSLKSRVGAPGWDWDRAMTKGAITVDSVYSGSFDVYLANLLPEHYSHKIYAFDFKFNGRPSEEFAFNGSLSARPAEQAAGPVLSAGFGGESRRFNITGAIRPNRITLDHVEVYLPEARLDVRLEIANYRKPDPDISFRADTSFIELEKLDRLIPPAYLNDPAAQMIRKSMRGGRFRVSGLSFNGPYSAFLRIAEPENMERIAGRLEVEDAGFHAAGMKHPVEKIKGVIDIKGNQLFFQDLSAVHGHSAIAKFGGSITGLRTNPYLKAVIVADMDIAELRDEAVARIASKKLDELIEPVRNIAGTARATVNVEAYPLEQRLTELDADLLFTNVNFRHEQFKVPVSEFNGIFHVTPTVIEIKEAAFNVEGSAITVSGAVRRYAEPEYDMDLKINVAGGIPRMAESPLFDERWRKGLTGNIAGSLALSGTLENLAFREELNLTQAGIKFPKFVDKRPGHSLNVAASGTLQGGNSLTIEEGRVDFGNSHIRFHGTAPDTRTWKAYAFGVNVDMLDLGDGSAYIPDFKEGAVAGQITGEIRVTDSGKAPVAAGTLKVKIGHFDLAQLERLKQELPMFGHLKLEGRVRGDMSIQFAPGLLPKLRGWVHGEKVGFYTMLPNKFQDLSGRIVLKGNMISFADIPFTSGNSSGEASGSVLIHKKPVFKLDVRAKNLDLADVVWLEGTPDPWWSEKPLFYTDLILTARSNAGTLASIPYDDLDLDMRYYRDRFTFKMLRFNSYQGTCEATGALNVAPRQPLFTTQMKVTGIELESLIKNFWPKMDKVTGKLNAEGSFNGEGLLWKDLRRTLNGTVRFETVDGLVEQFAGVAGIFSIINVAPLFEKQADRQKGNGLRYDSITGTMTIKDGVGHTGDLMMEGRAVRMSAAGDFRFNDGTVKLLIGVKPFTSVDSIISNIPVAGTLLTGEQKSLIVSYYDLTGPMDAPVATAVPGESVARTVLGIFQRALEAPAKALSTEKELEKLREKHNAKKSGKN